MTDKTKKKDDKKPPKIEDLHSKIDQKIKNHKKNAEVKTNELVLDIEKKLQDDEKIEIMTQFMLDPTSSATKLLEKRREMYELQEALIKDKQKFSEKEQVFKKTEEELRIKDEDFHKRIVDYYKNTFEKRYGERSSHEKKTSDEGEIKIKLNNEIESLKESNKKLKSNLDKMKEIYESLKEYEEFLQSVRTRQPDTYSDIGEIISKYKILETTLKELEDSGREMAKKKEEERNNFRNKKAEYENRINVILGEMNDIQIDLKNQKEKKKALEIEVTNFEKDSNNIASSLEQILLAIQNIYYKCDEKKNWTRHELEFPDKPDWTNVDQRVKIAKAMLKNINSYMEDYKEIEENCKSKSN